MRVYVGVVILFFWGGFFNFFNISGVYLVQVTCSYWSVEFLGHFLQVSALASHWLEDCANFTPTPEVNDKTVPFTLSAIQAVSQSTFINEPLVISGNDKNKQLTLLSQRKLALTAGNALFAL
jgi:hypothetical protein